MKSLLVETVRRLGAFAIGVGIAAAAHGGAFAQTGGKIPQFSANPSEWAWVRIRADGRNSLFGDGWLDPPTGLRGPIKAHPDHPLQGSQIQLENGQQVKLTGVGNNVYKGTVSAKDFLGDYLDFHVRVGDVVLQAKAHPSLRTPTGDAIYLRMKAHKCVAIPGVGRQ